MAGLCRRLPRAHKRRGDRRCGFVGRPSGDEREHVTEFVLRRAAGPDPRLAGACYAVLSGLVAAALGGGAALAAPPGWAGVVWSAGSSAVAITAGVCFGPVQRLIPRLLAAAETFRPR